MMNPNGEWDYWNGLEEDLSSFYAEDNPPGHTPFSSSLLPPPPSSSRPVKRRKTSSNPNGDPHEPPSPPLNPSSFSTPFSSPQMTSSGWPSPQMTSALPFFGSPTSTPLPTPYPVSVSDIPPMSLSDMSRLPPIDPQHHHSMQFLPPYSYLPPPPSSSSSQRSGGVGVGGEGVDPYGRPLYSEHTHSRSILSEDPSGHLLMSDASFQDPRMVMLDPTKPMNPYEDLKRQMICSLSYEIQLAMTSPEGQMSMMGGGAGAEERERERERDGMQPQDFTVAACQLDLPLLVAVLESREQWEGLEEGSALSNLCASVSSTLGISPSPLSANGQKLQLNPSGGKSKEPLSRTERLIRIEEATAELRYTVDRVLTPLYDFVAYRDLLLQHQCLMFRQLIKQICELQPHFNDLSMNFDTLCQHLRKRPRPPKCLVEKREDDLK